MPTEPSILSRWRTIPFRVRVLALTLAAICAAFAVPAVALSETESPLEVTLDSGPIRGTNDGDTRNFSGIPYAAPPVGKLRWRPPGPVEPWSEVRETTEPGHSCPQQAQPGGKDKTDEDCLYVNVTTPRKSPKKPRPVMVWFHGGGYSSGAGSDYDARRMAEAGDVIVVTVNSRLGVFGYFGHKGLEDSGNFGMADQVKALEWTKNNAEAFGGDAGNVTMFGQSSGAMSSCALLTSPKAEGLFDKAILSSGSCMLDWPKGTMYPKSPRYAPYSKVESTQDLGAELASEFDCEQQQDPVGCLRETSAKDLLPHMPEFANQLSYGTSMLPKNPAKAVRDGDFSQVPVISGGNHDEMRSFIAGVVQKNGAISKERYGELLHNSFGEQAEAVAEQYPLSDFDNPSTAWATLTTDVSWGCQTLRGDRELAEHTPLYAYEFADENAPNVNGMEVPEFPQAAAHANDLPYLFDLGGHNMLTTPDQKNLAEQMIGYWTSFAHEGSPSAKDAPSWARFTDEGPVMSLEPDPATTDFAADHQCEFWDDLDS